MVTVSSARIDAAPRRFGGPGLRHVGAQCGCTHSGFRVGATLECWPAGLVGDSISAGHDSAERCGADESKAAGGRLGGRCAPNGHFGLSKKSARLKVCLSVAWKVSSFPPLTAGILLSRHLIVSIIF